MNIKLFPQNGLNSQRVMAIGGMSLRRWKSKAMEVYIYSHHLTGDLFVLDSPLDDDTAYCRFCGDSDWLEFHGDDIWEIKDWLRSRLDVFGLGGYSEDYLKEILKKCENILGED